MPVIATECANSDRASRARLVAALANGSLPSPAAHLSLDSDRSVEPRSRDGWLTAAQAAADLDRLDAEDLSSWLEGAGNEINDLRAALERVQASVMFFGEDEWPAQLEDQSTAPSMLYLRGSLPAGRRRPHVAVVGSRDASRAALSDAHDIGWVLARAGAVLVSGLAAGIDTHAHQGSLRGNGINIAVIGTGIDMCFPPENAQLAGEIAASGAVISQFPISQRGSKTSFPARNRIVAALSDVVIVVEAAERSGTRITMELAAELGRPVVIWATAGREPWLQQWAADHPGTTFAAGPWTDILRIIDEMDTAR